MDPMQPLSSVSTSLASSIHPGVSTQGEAPLLRREAQWEWFGATPGSDPRVGELRWKYRASNPASVLKAQAQAAIHTLLVSLLKQPSVWREFSRSPEALALRKNCRMGASFNELGESLQLDGMRTSDLGPIREEGTEIWVQNFFDPAPASVQILGQTLQDYSAVRLAPLPRLLPFQVSFECAPSGGVEWKILSRIDGMPLSLSETLAISGVPSAILEAVVFRTLWSVAFMGFILKRAGIELRGGGLTWGLDSQGGVSLVSVLSPQIFGCAGALKITALGRTFETSEDLKQSQGFASLANHLLGYERFPKTLSWLEWITEPETQSTLSSPSLSSSADGV